MDPGIHTPFDEQGEAVTNIIDAVALQTPQMESFIVTAV